MRCIPTYAVMGAIDPELAVARERLTAYLEEVNAAATRSARSAALRSNSVAIYLCSVPRQQDGGSIQYAHIFHQDGATSAEEYFFVAASPRWWPMGCESLQPRCRTQSRAALRLVS